MTKALLLIIAFLTALFYSTTTAAQSQIAYQGFEQDSNDSWSVNFSTPPCSLSGDVWNYQNALGTITPSAGATFWGVQDLLGNCGSASGETLSFTSVNVSGYTSVSIVFDYNIFEFDNNDDVFYTLNIDGAPQPQQQLVNGSSNFSTNAYVTETIAIPDGSTSVALSVLVVQNGAADRAGFDNFQVLGIAPGGNAPPAISNRQQSPASGISSSDSVLVQADVTDVDGLTSVVLNYGYSSSNYTQSIPMSNTSGDQYQANIPAQLDGTDVFYSIQAVDANASPQISNSPELTYTVQDPNATNFIAVQDFDGSLPTWNYSTDVGFFDNGYGSDGYYGILDISAATPIDNPSFQNNILAENDLDDEGNGTSGFATTSFAPVDVSNYQNIDISFDYQMDGYNANNDDAKYEVFIDGVSQGEVFLIDGNGPNADVSGSVVIDVPEGSSSVSLTVSIRNNGAGGYSGFDNFALTGRHYDYIYDGSQWSPSDPSGISTSTENILVMAGSATLTASTDFNDLTIKDTATLDAGSFTHNVSGSIANEGIFIADEGGLNFNGNSAQSVSGNAFTLEDLILANASGLILNSSVELEGILRLTDGPLTSNDNLRLKSTSGKSAIVDQVVSGSLIGNLHIEQFYPAKRAFRFVSSPVNMASSVFTNWQQNGLNPGDSNYTPEIGTHITGGNPGDGFDASTSNNPSMFEFDNANQSWTAVPATNTLTYNAGTSVRLMIRGDRGVSLTTNSASPTDTRLVTTGSILTGDVGVPGLNATFNAFNMVGNPYQAQVDLSAVMQDASTEDIDKDVYYAWDPTIGSRGAYVVYDFTTQLNNVMGSEVNQFIQPWQGFFVQTMEDNTDPGTLAPALVFKESFKSSDINTTDIYSTPTLTERLRVGLYKTSELGSGKARDGVTITFGGSGATSLKFGNPDENLAILNNNLLQSTANLHSNQQLQVVQLRLTGLTATDYIFRIENLLTQGNVFFVDRYTGIEHALAMGNNDIQMVFTSDPGARDANRFYLKIERNILSQEDSAFAKAVHLYPNPLRGDQLNIKLPFAEEFVDIKLYNITGQLLRSNQQKSENGLVFFNGLQNFGAGVYILRISQRDRTSSHKLILK